MPLGIGIISYNRLAMVQRCVVKIREHTSGPYELVVADDGSTDGTVEWCRANGVAVVTGRNRGCAWNKNRALCYLMERTQCEHLVIIEDDSHPFVDGWDEAWAAAVAKWHHVNITTDPKPSDPERFGDGTVDRPWWVNAFWGNVTGITREAMNAVGYLDSHFTGWGWEHVEWTWRFDRHFGVKRVPGWRPGLVPCVSSSLGVKPTWDAGTYDPGEAKKSKNFRTMKAVENLPVPRPVGYTSQLVARMNAEVNGEEWTPSAAGIEAFGEEVERDRTAIAKASAPAGLPLCGHNPMRPGCGACKSHAKGSVAKPTAPAVGVLPAITVSTPTPKVGVRPKRILLPMKPKCRWQGDNIVIVCETCMQGRGHTYHCNHPEQDFDLCTPGNNRPDAKYQACNTCDFHELPPGS